LIISLGNFVFDACNEKLSNLFIYNMMLRSSFRIASSRGLFEILLSSTISIFLSIFSIGTSLP